MCPGILDVGLSYSPSDQQPSLRLRQDALFGQRHVACCGMLWHVPTALHIRIQLAFSVALSISQTEALGYKKLTFGEHCLPLVQNVFTSNADPKFTGELANFLSLPSKVYLRLELGDDM